MLAGMHNAENKVNTVLRASKDIQLALSIKRERQRNGQFWPIGFVESIIFEKDRDCQLDSIDARVMGRRLYWPNNYPIIAMTIPEQDLIFTQALRIPLPRIPDVRERILNPYKVDRHGRSHLKKGESPKEAPLVPQRLERIASAKYRNFLVFQPVAQIQTLTKGGFGVFGSHRLPLSSLTGFDGTKMALLIDPYTGEAIFVGGRLAGMDLRGQYTGATDPGPGMKLAGHVKL